MRKAPEECPVCVCQNDEPLLAISCYRKHIADLKEMISVQNVKGVDKNPKSDGTTRTLPSDTSHFGPVQCPVVSSKAQREKKSGLSRPTCSLTETPALGMELALSWFQPTEFRRKPSKMTTNSVGGVKVMLRKTVMASSYVLSSQVRKKTVMHRH